MTSNFGELVLVLGDFHIPSQEKEIPEEFKRMLIPNKCQHILCTGNLGSWSRSDHDMFDYLRTLAPNVYCVSGDSTRMMEDNPPTLSFPESRVVQIGDFRIGIIHGHQILPWGDHNSIGMIRRRLNVDILVSGHTHQNEVVEFDGCYHINPGSITGAFSPVTPNVIPSFMLLSVQDERIICYMYELIDGEVEISKTELCKHH